MKKQIFVLLCTSFMFSCGNGSSNENKDNDKQTIQEVVNDLTLEEQLIGKWKILTNPPEVTWECYFEFNQDGTGKWPGPWEGSNSDISWKIIDNDKLQIDVDGGSESYFQIEFIDNQLYIWEDAEGRSKENATICAK